MNRENPYKVLGILPSASKSEARAAFARLAKATHPDLNPGKPEEEYRRAREAFETIENANFIYVPSRTAQSVQPDADKPQPPKRTGPTTTFRVGPSPLAMPPLTFTNFAVSFFS
ncbi:MAG: J domain-containing protein [Patescibacteria group bacterium]|nr:J domain-containing protein [Patescibacteria group bacterium]